MENKYQNMSEEEKMGYLLIRAKEFERACDEAQEKLETHEILQLYDEWIKLTENYIKQK